MITLGIIEDDEIIRTIITKFLNKQTDIECVISSESIEEFYSNITKENPPEIILCDIDLPGMNGIDGIRKIKFDFPNIEFIMLTIHDNSHKIFEALRAGASGYLIKNDSLDEIKNAIDNILQGGSPLSSQVARKVIQYFKPNKKTPLSLHEKEVIQGFVDGLSYKMIGDKLDISLNGVRYHVKNIYKKLHVNSKTEVLQKSFRGEL